MGQAAGPEWSELPWPRLALEVGSHWCIECARANSGAKHQNLLGKRGLLAPVGERTVCEGTGCQRTNPTGILLVRAPGPGASTSTVIHKHADPSCARLLADGRVRWCSTCARLQRVGNALLNIKLARSAERENSLPGRSRCVGVAMCVSGACFPHFILV